jgi:hypothetical protein
VYFTKNGVRLGGEGMGGVTFYMVEAGLLYPVVGVRSGGRSLLLILEMAGLLRIRDSFTPREPSI